ncbi:PadR family transcriptional regulator [Candidatus Bathyarchaeota archaeon]|nr:PadR family transcriptional regulator [Candidatus Bathyarchaeota archaeon]MBS7630603.1 PadR family transcriptional regulator [Candidatus Bathyarchaeota archaeon]
MSEVERNMVRATVRGFSRAVILWLVNQKPVSGYRIVKEIERLTGQKSHSGIVYPLLYELEERGFIAGEWTQKGRRRIKQYSITENGTKLLNRLRELFEMPVKEVLKDLIGEDSE